jgi:hypothetical protein
MKKSLLLLTFALQLAITSIAHAEADTPQSLYLKAGREERQGETVRARQTYESIIDRFPESEFAVKANDRLLAITPPASARPAATPATAAAAATEQTVQPPTAVNPSQPQQTPATDGSKPAATPANNVLTIPLPAFLAPESPPPLPDDPVRRRGVEQARLHRKATEIYAGEIERRKNTFTTHYGHNYSRLELSRQEKEWQRAAADKVRKELGASLEEIGQQLQQACREAGIIGTCDEEAFLSQR